MIDECECENGYYCRFCRLMDLRDAEIELKRKKKKNESL
jgi:hypothetical protein